MSAGPVSTADVETQAVVHARNRMGMRNYGEPDYPRYAAYIDGFTAGYEAGRARGHQENQ